MISLICLKCGQSVQCEGFGFDAWCDKCKTWWETDWEYISEGEPAHWFTGNEGTGEDE